MKNEKVLALVKKARNKDKAAFAHLCEIKVNEVIFLCTREMGNPQDGQDAAQEVLIRMQKSILALKEPEAFNVWLNRLVHYTCLTMRRNSMKHKDALKTESFEEFLMDETLASLPEDFIETDENRRKIVEVIQELPAKYRECIVLHYYQSLSYIEIGRVLDISPDAVNNNMRMARKYLKRRLEVETREIKSSGAAAVSMLALGPILSKSLIETAAATVNAALAEECLAAAGVYTAFAGGTAAGTTLLAGIVSKTAVQVTAVSVIALAGVGALAYTAANQLRSSTPHAIVSTDAGFPQNQVTGGSNVGGEDIPVPTVQNTLSGRVQIKQNGEADPNAYIGLAGVFLQLVDTKSPNEVLQTVQTVGGQANGEFALRGMADGKYRLRIYLPRGAVVAKKSKIAVETGLFNKTDTWLAPNGETEFALTGGQTVVDNLDIELDYPAVLTGTIRLSRGGEKIAYDESSLQGVYILLIDPQKKVVGKTPVSAAGHYAFENPLVSQKGEYTLRVEADDTAVQLEIADSKVRLWPGYGV